MNRKNNEVVILLDEFFSDYLPDVKGLSSNTIVAYQYAFQLLFTYLSDTKKLGPPLQVGV